MLENVNLYKRLQEDFKAVDHECSRLERKEVEMEKIIDLMAEFIEDEFYKKMNLNLDDEIDNKIKKELLPFLCIRYDAKKNKRKLDFSPEYIFVKLLLFLNIKLNENDLNGNVNNYYKGCKRELKNKIEILRRVMNKDKASTNDYKIIRELYGFDISKEKDISKKDMYLLKTIYLTMKKIKNTMQAYQNNSKDFNIFNFIACFDLEKLYLVFSKCVLDYANEIYKLLPQEPIAAITEPLSYVSNTISDLGKDYNTSIKCYDLENNCFYDYDFQTLKKELEEYCSLFNTKIKRLTVEEIKMQGIKKAKEATRTGKISTTELQNLMNNAETMKKDIASRENEEPEEKEVIINDPREMEKWRAQVENKTVGDLLEEYEKEHPGTKHEVNERYAKNIEQVSKNFEKQSKTLETCEFEWKNNNVVRKPKEEKNKSDEEQYTM